MRPESRAREIRSGLFVIAGLAILAAFTLWIAGTRPMGDGRASYEVRLENAGGVRPGDSVRVAGIPVGRVTGVSLRPEAEQPVVFRVDLDPGVPITRASQARLASDGLLGSRYLAIELGEADAPPLAAGEAILGIPAGDVDQALARLDGVVDRAVTLLDETTHTVRGLSERLDALLSEENVEDVAATLQALRRTLEDTGPRLPPLLAKLETILDDLGKGTADLPEVTAEAQALVADLRQALGPGGERLAAVLDAAEGTMSSASDTLATVAGNSGDLEAAMRDLRAAAAELRALSTSLRERPSRLLRAPRKPDRRPGEGVEP